MNIRLTLLASLAGASFTLTAADTPPLDLNAPLQIQLWSGPAAPDAFAKAGLDPKTTPEAQDPTGLHRTPIMIGCYLVKGAVERPFVTPYNALYSPGGPLGQFGSNAPYGFFLITEGKQSEKILEFTCTLKGTTLSGRSKVDYSGKVPIETVWEGTLNGSTLLGTSAVVVAGKRLERPLVGLVRQAVFGWIDPANAIYSFSFQDQDFVVEFSGGKAVGAMARQGLPRGGAKQSAGQKMTELVEVDASALNVIVDPPAASGRSGQISGNLVVGGKSLVLGNMKVSPNGYTYWISADNKNDKVAGVAYSNTDPVAKRWKEWMSGLYTGTQELSQEVLAESAQEASLDAMPVPGPATAFTHYHRTSRQTGTYLYPPWMDFQVVPGATRYRFDIAAEKHTSTFESVSPQASLRPVWLNIPAGGVTVSCTALDGSGNPVGEKQKREIQKRKHIGEIKFLNKPIPDPLATQLALRFPRALAQYTYNYWMLFGVVQEAKFKPGIENVFGCLRSPYHALARWGETPVERANAKANAEFFFNWIANEDKTAMWLNHGYKVHYWNTLQSWGRTAMDDFETSGQKARLEILEKKITSIHRIQQPSGSWTLMAGPKDYPAWTGCFSFANNAWLDLNAGAYTLGLGRYRRLADDGKFLDAEIKANHWLARNSLRTGWWEKQANQGDDEYNRPNASSMLMDHLFYLVEHAPAEITNLAATEDLARYCEDLFVTWDAVPGIGGDTLDDIGKSRMALIWLHLYQQTGKAVYLAKAESMFTSYMQIRDQVMGFPERVFSRYVASTDDPWHVLAYLELRRKILAAKPTIANPADSMLVLNLDRAAEDCDRVTLLLDCTGGKVARAIATTPTWQPLDIPFTQPGRLHFHDQTTLFHRVDASAVKVDENGISGNVTVQLTGPAVGAKPVATTFALAVKPDHRVLTGTWTSGSATATRVAGEIRPSAITTPKRIHAEIAKAVIGGEAWQNWGLVRYELKDGKIQSTALSNNNSGWKATVDSDETTCNKESFTSTFKVTVTARKFSDNAYRGGDNRQVAEERKVEWKEGSVDWLAYWRIGRCPIRSPAWKRPAHEDMLKATKDEKAMEAGKGNKFDPQIVPLPWPEHTRIPGVEDKQGGKLEYLTSSQPVTPGTYEYKLNGQRLGDVIAGTVTMKGPDGKEIVSQFFGGVE